MKGKFDAKKDSAPGVEQPAAIASPTCHGHCRIPTQLIVETESTIAFAMLDSRCTSGILKFCPTDSSKHQTVPVRSILSASFLTPDTGKSLLVW